MDIINFLIVVALIHCALFFFNMIFQTCSHYPYILFLENTGLEIKIFFIKWCTTAFNRTIVKWTMNKTKFWALWFNIGAIVSIILLPIASLVIIKLTLNMLLSKQLTEENVPTLLLEPMIPGVNVPFNDIKYHVVALGLCSIVHEFGHALAASREDVQLYNVGIALFYIIPAAFVTINNSQLKLLPLQNQLRILCAGIWHNIVLALFAVIILYLSTWLWSPLFYSNSGIYVKSISHNSPLLGAKGLLVNDIIYRINDCDVKNNNDWYHCILQSIKQSTPGYCVSQSIIEEYDESIPSWTMVNDAVNCCSSSSISHGGICFEYIESGMQSDPLQLPLHSCLSARPIIEHSTRQCQTTLHCSKSGTHCMKPSLGNTTKIVRLMVKDRKDVLFVGHPEDIYRTITVTDWIPKYKCISTNIPESLKLMCEYIALTSASLAVMNIIPCFFFDSQHIMNTLVHNLFYRTIKSKSTQHATALTITSVGSFLLIVNILYAILKM